MTSRLIFLLILVAASLAMPAGALAQDDGTPPAPAQPCSDGRLRIADLVAADETMTGGIADAIDRATAWEDDARMTTLILGCPLLSTGFQWQGIFFSETAQAYFHSGTDNIQATNDDPEIIRTLVTEGLSLTTLHRSLVRAGFTDDLVIDISNGVTVRYNTRELGFGPSYAPENTIYYHVAIVQRGEIKDVWVSAADGTIYRYDEDE